MNKKATVPGYSKVWYEPTAMTNVFSLAKMQDKCKVKFKPGTESYFMVTAADGKSAKFERGLKSLYYFKPTYRHKICMVETVTKNETFYTKRQQDQAKRAQALLHTIGCPTIADLTKIISIKTILNCPITTEDVNIAEKIYRPDIASIKGKATRRKPNLVVKEYVEIPNKLIMKQKEVDLCIDTMEINGMPFLATVFKEIKYRTVEFVKSKTVQEYRSALERVLNIYKQAECKVKTISADREFILLLEEMKVE